MEPREYSVLIVSAAAGFSGSLTPVLTERRCRTVTAKSVSAARRLALEREFDVVVVDAPLPDETGAAFAIDVCGSKNAVAVIFVRADDYDEMCAKMTEQGVFTLPKPISRQSLSRSLDWLAAARERLRGLEKRSLSLEDKMAEIRIVNRAKWALITKRGMTEPEAHRYIEKLSMDRCVSKRQTAEEILRLSEEIGDRR